MSKYTRAGFFALALAALPMARAHAQTVTSGPLPVLEADTLGGAHVTLPRDANGAPIVLLIAFDRSAESQLQTWSHAALEKFGTRAKVYAVVDAAGAPFFVHGAVKKAIAKDAPSQYPQHASNILITFNKDPWSSIVPNGRGSDVAEVLVDAKGAIIAARRDAYAPAALEALVKLLP